MSNYTNYWGKSGDDFVPCKRLIYHCLDVAAVGQVLLQLVLQHNDYEDILTQNITHDKKISQSLITFFVLMHDLGKFSYRFQNRDQDAVKKVHGRLSDKYYSVDHDELGFLLCQKVIWLKIWDKNWLGLDQSFDESDWQDVLKSWFRAVTMHHRRRSNIDFQNKLDNLEIYFIDENKKDACNFIEDAAKFVLNIKSKKPLLEIHKSLDDTDTYKYTSDLLRYLTDRSDKLVSSNHEYFDIPWTSSIEQYWTEVLRCAELAVKDAKIDSSEIIEFNQYFFRKRDLIVDSRLQGIALINKAKDDYIPNRRIDKAIECYYGAIEFFNKANAEDLLNKYESELRRLELKNDYSLSNPAKTVTLDNPTNKNKISKPVDKEFDRCLFEILRNLRNELTNGKHHLLFPNESLEAMATSFPQDLESLKKITGTGKNYEKYGKLFLEKIVTYCKVQKTNSERCYPTELQEILNLCKQNLTLKEIAQKRKLEVNTIIGHIEELILCGAKIPIDKFVNAKKLEHMMRALSNIGYEKIERTIREKYSDFLTNEEIRFVKAYKIRNDK